MFLNKAPQSLLTEELSQYIKYAGCYKFKYFASPVKFIVKTFIGSFNFYLSFLDTQKKRLVCGDNI